jgi:hypothetical protein
MLTNSANLNRWQYLDCHEMFAQNKYSDLGAFYKLEPYYDRFDSNIQLNISDL